MQQSRQQKSPRKFQEKQLILMHTQTNFRASCLSILEITASAYDPYDIVMTINKLNKINDQNTHII